MKRTSALASFGAVALLGLTVTSFSVDTVQAKPQEPQRERPKSEDPPEWSEPVVQGTIDKMWWAESKVKGQWTPTFSLFSNESNLEVTVYVDEPTAQQLTANRACVGRFVVATGNRIDEQNMSALGIELPGATDGCAEGQGIGALPS